eukprot:44681-Eustigmatos_ZCMA.PRE.1
MKGQSKSARPLREERERQYTFSSDTSTNTVRLSIPDVPPQLQRQQTIRDGFMVADDRFYRNNDRELRFLRQ